MGAVQVRGGKAPPHPLTPPPTHSALLRLIALLTAPPQSRLAPTGLFSPITKEESPPPTMKLKEKNAAILFEFYVLYFNCLSGKYCNLDYMAGDFYQKNYLELFSACFVHGKRVISTSGSLDNLTLSNFFLVLISLF